MDNLNSHSIMYLICVGLFCSWLLYILFNTDGMYSMIKKAASMVLQQIFSLILTVVFLFFKILNSVEIYIVLLIDVLTGKRTAISKVTVLAICSLSIASYYTTFKGMQNLVGDWIAALITIGVQTFLLIASLQIGLSVDLNKVEKKDGWHYIKNIEFIIYILLSLVCFVLYRNIQDDEKKNILYLATIIFFALSIIRILHNFVINKSKNKFTTNILMILYFMALSFSSFFSYNSFMNVLYEENVRYEDSFLRTKNKIIEAVNSLENGVIKQEYKEVKENLGGELTKIQDELNKNRAKYETYKKDLEIKEDLYKQEKEIKEKYDKLISSLINNTGNDFGPESSGQIAEWEVQREKEIQALKSNDGDEKGNNKGEEENKDNWDKYKYFEELVNVSEENKSNIFILLQKEDWDSEDVKHFRGYINILSKLEGVLEDNTELTYNATQLLEYKEFRRAFKKNYQEILNCHFAGDISLQMYNGKIDNLFESAYKIIDNYPLIYNDSSATYNQDKADSVIKIEEAFHNSSQDAKDLEKNIKAFFGSKILALICAVIAVLIDCLILFVGLLTPKPIDYFEDTNRNEEKRQAILEHLFNKPMK